LTKLPADDAGACDTTAKELVVGATLAVSTSMSSKFVAGGEAAPEEVVPVEKCKVDCCGELTAPDEVG